METLISAYLWSLALSWPMETKLNSPSSLKWHPSGCYHCLWTLPILSGLPSVWLGRLPCLHHAYGSSLAFSPTMEAPLLSTRLKTLVKPFLQLAHEDLPSARVWRLSFSSPIETLLLARLWRQSSIRLRLTSTLPWAWTSTRLWRLTWTNLRG